MKNRISNLVIAIALVAIAANMTYSNARKPATEPVKAEERVVQVIGRVSSVFDGIGVTTGFLAKDGDKLVIVRYDMGSMADNEAYQPKYLNVVKMADGQIVLDNITVEKFN